MKYIPPLNALPGDEEDDNRSHWNADPSGENLPLRQGAFPSAVGFEAVQREILNVITAFGLTPDDEDYTQCAQAIAAAIAENSSALPVGMPFPVWDNLTGVTAPDNSGSEKYIKLTAGEDGVGEYNEGLLTNESVSGTAPLVTATADIDLAGSPLNGQTVHLINSEEAFIRARETSGALQQDQFQGHALWFTGSADGYAKMGAVGTTSERSAVRSDNSDPSGQEWREDAAGNGTPREGSETRSKNVSATFYMRIL